MGEHESELLREAHLRKEAAKAEQAREVPAIRFEVTAKEWARAYRGSSDDTLVELNRILSQRQQPPQAVERPSFEFALQVTDHDVWDAGMSWRHDFGLLAPDDEDRKSLECDMRKILTNFAQRVLKRVGSVCPSVPTHEREWEQIALAMQEARDTALRDLALCKAERDQLRSANLGMTENREALDKALRDLAEAREQLAAKEAELETYRLFDATDANQQLQARFEQADNGRLEALRALTDTKARLGKLLEACAPLSDYDYDTKSLDGLAADGWPLLAKQVFAVRRTLTETAEPAPQPVEPDPAAPLDVSLLPDWWDGRRVHMGKPDKSRCAAELRRALSHNSFGHVGTDFFAQQHELSQPVEPAKPRLATDIPTPRDLSPDEKRAATEEGRALRERLEKKMAGMEGVEPAKPQVTMEALAKQVKLQGKAIGTMLHAVATFREFLIHASHGNTIDGATRALNAIEKRERAALDTDHAAEDKP